MQKIRRGVCNIPDFKTEDGLWSKGYTETTESEYIYYHTRGGKLWNGMKNRCKVGGSAWANMPTYQGTNYLFSDFQFFVDWCSSQAGYLEVEDFGKFWQLDKDILVPGNQTYAANNCCFVPTFINSLLVNCDKTGSEMPLGVGWHLKANKYVSKIKVLTGETKHLGLFISMEKAASVWLQEKSILISLAAEKYINHSASREDVYQALMSRSEYMKECSINNIPLYKI